MKNSQWFHGLCLAAVLFSVDSSASTEINIPERLNLTAKVPLTPLSSADIQVTSGGNLESGADRIMVIPADRPLSGGRIELKTPGSIQNQGAILSAQVMPLPSEPTFWALHWTSGITRIGDYFDVEVLAISPLANASLDELILGFGFNTALSGTGSAQFLGSSVNPLFDDISTQDGVNLTAAGFAFPGFSVNDVGSLLSLAVLHFQALTAGDLSIAISSDLNDFNQGLIYLTQSPLAIQANTHLTITAVPLPPAIVLFVTGCFMLMGRRMSQAWFKHY
jgi:hypothetical protein